MFVRSARLSSVSRLPQKKKNCARRQIRSFSSTNPSKMEEVVIVSTARTPIGSMGGALASISAVDLGAIAIEGALSKAKVDPKLVQEVYMGNVLQANLGQAPARQAALKAGLSTEVPCTTVNKVCASGMKAVMLAAQNIMTGNAEVMVAGGMESMSNVPYYLPGGRNGMRYGHGQVLDGVLKDGLWDVYNDFHMGNCGEDCAKKFNISREEQDNFAIRSYTQAMNAHKNGFFKEEIIPVEISPKRGEKVTISEDEEYKKMKMEKIPTLRPAFDKNGTITAANASKLNDGASALVLMSAKKAKELGLKPLARINGFADAANAPIEFTTAPAKAIPIALQRAGISQKDVSFYEINEAFSVVALANNKLLNLDPETVNVWGGAVALGHPIGSSGSRIISTLVHILNARNGKYGVAAICNGGGGAGAIVIEKL